MCYECAVTLRVKSRAIASTGPNQSAAPEPHEGGQYANGFDHRKRRIRGLWERELRQKFCYPGGNRERTPMNADRVLGHSGTVRARRAFSISVSSRSSLSRVPVLAADRVISGCQCWLSFLQENGYE